MNTDSKEMGGRKFDCRENWLRFCVRLENFELVSQLSISCSAIRNESTRTQYKHVRIQCSHSQLSSLVDSSNLFNLFAIVTIYFVVFEVYI